MSRTITSLSESFGSFALLDLFKNRRLLESIGNISPAEAEAIFYATQETEAMAA